MRKISVIVGLVVALGLMFSGPAYGAEGKAKEKKVKAGCSECQGLKGKISEKKNEMDAVKREIKTAKETAKAEKQAKKAAKLEALKKSNPEKYAKLMEKMAAKKKDGRN